MEKLASGTTRKCANCGQVGHIKTNKKYATLPSLSSPRLVGGPAAAAAGRPRSRSGIPQAREAPGKPYPSPPRAVRQAAQARGETASQEADRNGQRGEEAGSSGRKARQGSCEETKEARQRATPSCKASASSFRPRQTRSTRGEYERNDQRCPHARARSHSPTDGSCRCHASTLAAFDSSLGSSFHLWPQTFQFTPVTVTATLAVSLTRMVSKVMSPA